MDSLSGIRIGEVDLTTSSSLLDDPKNSIPFSGCANNRHSPGAAFNNGVAAPFVKNPLKKRPF
jgi:hypothetical protein